jgi:uncharacterized protein YyaL (SSP411 family)
MRFGPGHSLPFILLLATFVLIQPWFIPPCVANQLAGNESPYLAMHGDDPVDWVTWSPDVLKRARKQNRLVFVSIGYYSCYWCHVMQRESYRNNTIATLLNNGFIPVKVDRELNPALDAYLNDFVSRTRGYSGWPLNVFLTPAGNPLVGFVYIPPDRFQSVLKKLQQQWQKSPEYFKQVAARVVAEMKMVQTSEESPLSLTDVKQYEGILVQQALELSDDMSGGFGEQNKFPMVPQLRSLLSVYQQTSQPALKQLLIITLDNMASQGLRDHLGGGFFRYTVDPNWQTPHFEKMLYDNALLASLYLRAAEILKRPDYEKVGRDTLDFMIGKMTGASGAMVASFSASDEKNTEGAYYLWEEEALKKLLNKNELKVMQLVWGLKGQKTLESDLLPRETVTLEEAAKTLAISPEDAERYFQLARKKMLQVRSKRTLLIDGKYLAAWNGLALSALVEGARLENSTAYRQAAKRIRDYLVEELWDGKHLLRAKGRSSKLGQATLQDYAFVAQGLLAWAKLNDNKQDVQLVKNITEDAWSRFHDKTGWKLSDQTLISTGHSVPIMEEGPLPSPSAIMLRVSTELARYENDQSLMNKVLDAMRAGHSQLKQQAFNYPSQVSLLVDYFSGS